jgi:hypothetical protein
VTLQAYEDYHSYKNNEQIKIRKKKKKKKNAVGVPCCTLR